MRVIVFGDVHGNLVALEKLFLLERSADIFICHGDVVNYGPWTNECVALLDSINNCKILKGNHEKYFLEGFYDGTNEVAKAFFEHCYFKFDKKLKDILSRYDDETNVNEYKIQHTIAGKYIFSDTDISKIEINSNYIIGHSHQQFEKTKDEYTIFNTGSLGQDRALINRSCYLIVDTSRNKVFLQEFSHDIDKVINQMRSEKYPQICTDYYLSKQRLSK